jgi:uncharacterized Zn finger protein (UPF0148 family)
VALLKTRCPECNAPLKSSTGFTVGQTVCCPKCETYFAVEEPEKETDESEEDEAPKKATAKSKTNDAPAKKPLKAAAADDDDDDNDEKPKKKKKNRAYDDDEEPKRSYKNSPLRYAILGVLVVIMLVLGYMLIEKKKKERELAKADESPSAPSVPSGQIPPPPIMMGPNIGRPPGGGPGVPLPKQKLPVANKQPNGQPVGPAGNPLGGFVGGAGPIPGTPEAQKLTQALTTALVATWTADLGDGVTEELTYTAAGTYTQKLTGPTPTTVSGKYIVKELVGSKGLKIQIDTAAGSRTVRVTFEDDELQHPTLQPGVTGSFRKK